MNKVKLCAQLLFAYPEAGYFGSQPTRRWPPTHRLSFIDLNTRSMAWLLYTALKLINSFQDEQNETALRECGTER